MRPLLIIALLALSVCPLWGQTVVGQGRPVNLDQPVTITIAPAGSPLPMVLDNLSSISGVSIHTTAGQHTIVRGTYTRQPLRQVLNSLCESNGLQWELQAGVVLVRPRLTSETFIVERHAIPAVKRLFDNGVIERLMNSGGAVRGQRVFFDDSLGVVSITSEPSRIEEVRATINQMSELEAPAVRIETRMYEVDRAQANRLKTLLEARLAAEDEIPGVRRVIVEGGTIVVRDTEANLQIAERILTGEEGLESEDLDVRVYNLFPENGQQSPEMAQRFADQVVETVRTVLYATEGEEAAQEQGRRLWYDPELFQLTVTDFPANIGRIDRYIAQVPELESDRRVMVRIPLGPGQRASEVAQRVQQLVNVETANSDQPLMGDLPSRNYPLPSTGIFTRTMSRGDEVLWQGMRLTLVDILGPVDEPDTAIFVIDTPTSSLERSIRERRSEFVGQTRIRVTEISRSDRVTVEITRVPDTDTTILQ